MHGRLPVALVIACLAYSSAARGVAAGPLALSEEERSTINAFLRAEILLAGRLEAATPGPQGLSMPPVHTTRLEVAVGKVLRGSVAGGRITAAHSARQVDPPSFPVGAECIVAARKDPRSGRIVAEAALKATPGLRRIAALAASLPLGWRAEKGGFVSPWAGLGAKAWPAGKARGDMHVCSTTGRPALLAGPGATLKVEPVPPRERIKWTNPDGDGEYRITVANTGAEAVSVPALLSLGGRILWEESLVVLSQGKARPAPGAKGLVRAPGPAVLQPGQSVATVVNVMLLDGIEWPRGGYRVEFRFCLGELSSTQSFYYLSRHHDKVRDAARRAAGL